MTKVCSRCKLDKSDSAFSPKHSYCHDCKKEYMAAYWKTHAKERKEFRKRWRASDRKKNPSKHAAATKRRRHKDLNHTNHIAKIWRDANPDKVRGAQRRHFQTSPTRRLTERLRNRIYQALVGLTKSRHSADLLGCSIDELKSWLSGWFQPGMSWENYGQWHIDHRFPCASFNLADPEQQRRCFHYLNLQPLWAKDNLSKGSKKPHY